MAERKGKKLRRCTAASKAYYNLQYGKTDSNRKKRMQRHIRANPFDVAIIATYETVKNFGRADTLGVSSRGKKLVKRHERELKRLARSTQGATSAQSPES